MKSIMGIDLGTSSLKVSVFSENLTPILHNKQTYPTRYTPDGGCEQDASDYRKALIQALKEISETVPLKDIQGIGFSGFNTLVGVDAFGEAAGPVITYLDKRGLSVFDKLKERIPAELIFSKTKNNLTFGGTWAPSLCWIKEEMPDYWARSHTFVTCSGFLAGWLTKTYAVDASRASFSLLHDIAGSKLDWDDELCGLFGIDLAKLPPILQSWDRVGTVQSDIARLTGLPEGVPVIIGGVDSMCAALGSGITDESTIFDIGGSAGGLAAVSTSLRVDPRFLNVRFVLPGRWANIGPLSVAGSAWKWLISNWLDNRFSGEELLERAETVPPGSEGILFLPYLAGIRCPDWDMSRQATFHGITMNHNYGHLARAVLEGVTYSQRDVMDALLELGYMPQAIRSAGGGANNKLWMQMKADILNIPHFMARIEEASAFGAALLTAHHLGLVTDFAYLANQFEAPDTYWRPTQEMNRYNDMYLHWSKLKQTLRAN